MHLHGFFFSVDGEGDGERFEQYAEAQRRLAVTEHIDVGNTFDMTGRQTARGIGYSTATWCRI